MSDLSPGVEGAPRTRRRRTALYLAATVLVVVVCLVAVLATRPLAGTRAADSPLVGRAAPPISGLTIDGDRLSDAASPGRWTLVNFFATWCVPCRKEHPDLIRFAERHAARGDAAVVGVVYSDATSAVRKFRQSEGGDWPIVTDPDGRIALDFGVSGVPESFLVSPRGVIVAKILGGVTDDRLEELLSAAKRRN